MFQTMIPYVARSPHHIFATGYSSSSNAAERRKKSQEVWVYPQEMQYINRWPMFLFGVVLE